MPTNYTADDPRQVMFDTFGRKWAMEYEPKEITAAFMKYFPRGIKVATYVKLSPKHFCER